MNLAIDAGNTLTKLAFFDKEKMVASFTYENLTLPDLKICISKFTEIQAAVLSSVSNFPEEIIAFLKDNYFFVFPDASLPLPIKINYLSTETLGIDRIASAVAAHSIFPGKNVLSIGAGTCLIYDIVNKAGFYSGGAISPGLQMRFRALNTFTGKLPLVDYSPICKITGNTTEKSILSGVVNGISAEMDGMINFFRSDFPELKVILSGGDLPYFENRLKNSIFALPNVVLIGLNIILLSQFEKSNC